ncbi:MULTISPECIES: hypothetical protein [Nocardia]|uniref:hypothetical protein n=1 Tax=Nocardia TaxID=1817 RepID=UPI0024579E66|nr:MULTISPECIES: hypothetical protein [Nocardia]
MPGTSIRLKTLLRERHWQKYGTFCREYDRVAGTIEADLVGTAPSRGQLHRWLAGDLKGLPYPDHCRVLEAMFPGWTAERLFEAIEDDPSNDAFGVGELIRAVSTAIRTPDAHRVGWTSSGAGGSGPVRLEGAINSSGEAIPDSHMKIAKKLISLARVLRIDDIETAKIASLAGQVVELEMNVGIVIGEGGYGRVTYRHDLFNMSNEPVSRIPREVWFEHTPKPLTITPIPIGPHRTLIQRLHDTPGLAKFACQISPPIQPGETGTVSYECTGGQFVSDHYWRQSAPRYTRHLTLTLHHKSVGKLLSYSAQEEQVSGAENSVSDSLIWENDGDDVSVTLTRDYLRPGQCVTLRWDVEHIERSHEAFGRDTE